MKTTHDTHTTVGHMPGTAVKSRLNDKRMGMIMDMLVKKYNHPHTAALREYVSNAYDSHKSAGIERPVEVTLPTSFSPDLTVRDFGLGMTHSEVVEIYSGLGFTTKDEDDLSIGGFGIGSKAGLAVTNQFSVVAVKDGLLNSFLATRENSLLVYKFAVENQPTDQPNGVTVTVPMSRVFRSGEVLQVLDLWKSSEVFVTNPTRVTDSNGMSHDENSVRIADTWIETDNGYIDPALFNNRIHVFGRSYGVPIGVGPVLYMSEDRRSNLYTANINRPVVKMTIGEIRVASSREVLEETEENKQAIKKRTDALIEDIISTFNEKLKNCKHMREAVVLNESAARKFITTSEIMFRGEKVPTFAPAIDIEHVSYKRNINSRSGRTISITKAGNALSLRPKYLLIEKDVETTNASITSAMQELLVGFNHQDKSVPEKFNPFAQHSNPIIMGKTVSDLFEISATIKVSEILEIAKTLRKKNASNAKSDTNKVTKKGVGSRIVSVLRVESTPWSDSVGKTDMTLDDVRGMPNVRFAKRTSYDNNEIEGILNQAKHRPNWASIGKLIHVTSSAKDEMTIVMVPKAVKNLAPYLEHVEGSQELPEKWLTETFETSVRSQNAESNGMLFNLLENSTALKIFEIATKPEIFRRLNKNTQETVTKSLLLTKGYDRSALKIAAKAIIKKGEVTQDFQKRFALASSFHFNSFSAYKTYQIEAFAEYVNNESVGFFE